MKIQVTGFPMITSAQELERVFSNLGTVTKVEKETHKNTAYITMPYAHQGNKAIKALDGTKILGRIITVQRCF